MSREEDSRDTNDERTRELARRGRTKTDTEGTARVTRGSDQVTVWSVGRAPADATERWAAARRGLRRRGGVGGPGVGGFTAALLEAPCGEWMGAGLGAHEALEAGAQAGGGPGSTGQPL